MFDKKFTVLPEEMRLIARYEKTFQEYENDEGDPFADTDFPLMYETQPEDLLTALTNMLRKNATMREVAMHWFFPITFARDQFGLQGTNETELIYAYVLAEMLEMFMQMEPQDRVAENASLRDACEAMRFFVEDADKPLLQRRFTQRQKRMLIHRVNEDDAIKDAEEEQLPLIRAFAEELAEQGDAEALEMVAYGCYEGNRVFAQDYVRAKECLETLYSMTGKPVYANSLGYIHFYGRCGETDYAKAREYFLQASMGGLYQATYKLADMIAQGLGCPKNPAQAKQMYEWVYSNCLEEYTNGNYDCEFCDAAVRLGRALLDGNGTEKDPVMALGYFMEAEHAVRKRMQSGGTLSDGSVLSKARQGIQEAKEQIGPAQFKKHMDMDNAQLIVELLRGARLRITAKQPAKGHLKLQIRRFAERYSDEAAPLLISFPTMNFCEDVMKITLQALSGEADFDTADVDHCEWDEDENRLELYYDEKLVGTVRCEGFRFTPPAPKKEKTVRLAGVKFSEYSQVYDYLCDDEDIAAGDRVFVPSPEGEREVTVESVREEAESELKLPLERYKKVLRKA